MTRKGDVKVFWKNTIRPKHKNLHCNDVLWGEWRFFQKPVRPDLDIP
jgi:hypothetical protein